MSKIKQALPEGYEPMAGVNQIAILEPRWHDRVVLVAEHRLLDENEIIILHHEFNKSYYITNVEALKYPVEYIKTKSGHDMAVRAIPIDELDKEYINVGS